MQTSLMTAVIIPTDRDEMFAMEFGIKMKDHRYSRHGNNLEASDGNYVASGGLRWNGRASTGPANKTKIQQTNYCYQRLLRHDQSEGLSILWSTYCGH